jgi:hypothetical protein
LALNRIKISKSGEIQEEKKEKKEKAAVLVAAAAAAIVVAVARAFPSRESLLVGGRPPARASGLFAS